MKPNEGRYGGWRSLARTAGLLVSLVGAVGFGAQGCSAGEEPTSKQSEALLIGTCDEGSDNCPEALTGTCGLLYCATRATCEFKSDANEGDKCETDGGVQGFCLTVETPQRVRFLECCTGCVDGQGRCRPGDNNAFCGGLGDKCDTCGTCSTCKEGRCVDAGDGSSCTNGVSGRCLSGSCCIGCIKAGACYLNAVDNCGRNGGACADCDDDKPCTQDSCTTGTCGHTNVPGACDPGNACITGASCSGSTCTGQPKVCNDNNDCTTDSCDSATGCQYAPLNSGACNDGNACTEGDSCAAGDCDGNPVVCNDNNPCTADTCDPDTGCKFTNLGENVECDDGNDCSTGDRCTNGGVQGAVRTCVATGGKSCVSDDNACTRDFYADCSDTTCTYEPIEGSCSTSLCKVNEVCANGTCGGGTDVDCDDGNPCTVDTCDDEEGCVRTPQAGACNDGNPCTIDDACNTDDGECVGTPVTCTAAGECYDPGECNETTGTCSDLRKPNDTPCGTTGTCQSGQCVGDGVVTGEGGGDGMGSAGDGNSSAGTGGTNNAGGSSGAPTTGEGGNGEPGSAGSDNSAGGSGGTDTVGSSGSDNGSGASPGDAGSGSGEVYVRDPGGCSCSVPGTNERSGRAYGALALALGLAYAARRRRHATF